MNKVLKLHKQKLKLSFHIYFGIYLAAMPARLVTNSVSNACFAPTRSEALFVYLPLVIKGMPKCLRYRVVLMYCHDLQSVCTYEIAFWRGSCGFFVYCVFCILNLLFTNK